MTRDPYEVLGVGKDATMADIKKAYRKLAKTNHPDLHPGDAAAERRFKEISRAQAVLGDKTKRGRFDRGEIDADGNERMETPFHGHNASGPGGARYEYHGGDADLGDLGDLGDIFSTLFGGGIGGQSGFDGRGDRPYPGRDMRYELAVDFLDAVNGAKRRVVMADGGHLDVTLPKGLRDGQTIRLKNKGMAGINGGPAGDALVTVKVRGHAGFRRVGDDIHVTRPVSLSDAVLGGRVQVETVAGPVTLTVPENSNSGRVLRLKGKGVRRAGKPAGDQLVTLRIALPKSPDPELVALLRRQREAEKVNDASMAMVSG